MVVAGDLQDTIARSPLLRGIETVIHLVGRAHVLRQEDPGAESLYQSVNAAGSATLATSAAERFSRDVLTRRYIALIEQSVSSDPRGSPVEVL